MVAAFPTSNLSPAVGEEKHGVKSEAPPVEEHDEDEFQRGNAPLKYMTLCEVYSVTSPCVTASGLKKVKAAARKPPQQDMDEGDQFRTVVIKPAVTRVYSRQKKRKDKTFLVTELSEDGLSGKKVEEGGEKSVVKRRKFGSSAELMKLGVDCEELSKLDVCHTVDKLKCRSVQKDTKPDTSAVDRTGKKRKNDPDVFSKSVLKKSGGVRTKKWVWLRFEGIDPKKFIGLQCKVYWPLDARWYSGRVLGYILEAGRHYVKYEDDEEENLILANERVKFYVSDEEMQSLKLRCLENSSETDAIDVNEMMVLAASLDDCQEVECGDIIWAKLTGHAVWPAIVLDESQVGARKGLNKTSGEKSVIVQFFGTYDFARVTKKQVISFLKGLLSSCHLKCKKPAFARALEEAKMYLSEQKLPKDMLQLRDGGEADNNDCEIGEQEDGADSSDEECLSHEEISRKLEDLKSCQLESGELQVISLGKLVKDSDNFQKERFMWPEGYTAMRKFSSIVDPSVCILYKMQVLRDVDSRTRPLFRVTTDDGEEFNGSTPSACWNKIYERVRKVRTSISDPKAAVETEQSFKSGSFMFGFSHPKVSKLIQEMSNSRLKSKSSQSASKKTKGSSSGYRSVHVEWRDLDKCNVCHMDEEYESNLFLQCDKCRMMVHARCYGELEPNGGALWLCNLCRPGAPALPPPCCLCPIIGGAMKLTTDGQWAHLACAIWIPETCLSDIKKMEPIDGIHRIHKGRWKLLCSICGVPYGACIQCSNNSCRVAYHPLCARVAGFCLEPEDVDRLHLIPFDEDEEDQCIQLFSFCKKHMPVSNEPLLDERIGQQACECGDYTPPSNPSGCARTEPYNSLKRRGRNEPEVLAAVSSKRLYLENNPYLVGGYSPHMPFRNKSSSVLDGSKYSIDLQKLQMHQLDPSGEMLLVSDKYRFMRDTFRKRLAFGKSKIHGFGVFAKCRHRAGDMIVEYAGEIIRPSVADKRELSIYNSLVGAGTYMFRVDDERVVDATRAGSIAHLINHSCEPNCYSRTISINGNDHIIIFAKRDIKQWEELTYDYRFASKDQRLACYCGFPRCRGVVNDAESMEREKGIYVPRSELKDWEGE